MEKLVEKLNKYLIKEGYKNIKFTSDNNFVVADAKYPLLAILKDENWVRPCEDDENKIYRTAYRSGKRVIWLVELNDGELEWSLF